MCELQYGYWINVSLKGSTRVNQNQKLTTSLAYFHYNKISTLWNYRGTMRDLYDGLKICFYSS